MKIFLFVILLLCPLFSYADPATPTFQEGRDYLTLPTNASTTALQSPGKITVIEFFNYGCPACNNLEPFLEKWVSQKPHNVVFERIPVVFESGWSVYAKTYLALTQLKLENKITPIIFKAVHDDQLDLSDIDAMASFLNSTELKKEIFLNTYNSPDIDLQMAKNKKITNDFLIFQIPGIVIEGKYKVDPSLSGGNYPRLIDTLNYLIELEKKS